MEEAQSRHLCGQGHLYGHADRRMPPAGPRSILFVHVLRVANVQISPRDEPDELRVQPLAEIPAGLRSLPQMRQRLTIRLVVGRIDQRIATVGHAKRSEEHTAEL